MATASKCTGQAVAGAHRGLQRTAVAREHMLNGVQCWNVIVGGLGEREHGAQCMESAESTVLAMLPSRLRPSVRRLGEAMVPCHERTCHQHAPPAHKPGIACHAAAVQTMSRRHRKASRRHQLASRRHCNGWPRRGGRSGVRIGTPQREAGQRIGEVGDLDLEVGDLHLASKVVGCIKQSSTAVAARAAAGVETVVRACYARGMQRRGRRRGLPVAVDAVVVVRALRDLRGELASVDCTE